LINGRTFPVSESGALELTLEPYAFFWLQLAG
jgi:hypothetical protein